jgi:hypothetical protein
MEIDPLRMYDIDFPTFGIAAGLYADYPIGFDRFVGDVRFLFDLLAVMIEDGAGALSRRGLVIGIGYEITL